MQNSFIFVHSGGHEEYLTHDMYFAFNAAQRDNELRPLQEKYRHRQLNVYCSCKSPRPVMYLKYRNATDSVYLTSADKDQHSDTCFYSRKEGEYSSTSTIYAKGFEENDDGRIEIKLNEQDFQFKKSDKDEASTDKSKSATRKSLDRTIGVSVHKPSIYAIMLRLTTEAWNDIIQYHHYQKQEYPVSDATTLFRQLLNRTVKKYRFKKVDAEKILYKGEKEGKVAIIKNKQNSPAFTMLLLNDEGIQCNEESYRITVKNPVIGAERQLDVPMALFLNALKAVRGIPGPYVAGGFLVSPGYKQAPVFISFGLVPINMHGAPIESSYERELYDVLCGGKRAVTRPLLNEHQSWKGYIPDGLLLDTKPRTILEVFGMSENTENYHRQRTMKISHFSSLQPKFNFWYWDAFKTKEIPTLW